MNPELIIYIVNKAIETALASIAAFKSVTGREPTLEEWKSLELGWKSPEQIEAEVRARFSGASST